MPTGINCDLGDGLAVLAAYTLMWLGDLDVEQSMQRTATTLSGTYDNSALHVLGDGVTWRF